MTYVTDDLIWSVRAFVYQRFADTARAANVDEVAAQFHLTRDAAAEVYAELDRLAGSIGRE